MNEIDDEACWSKKIATKWSIYEKDNFHEQRG